MYFVKRIIVDDKQCYQSSKIIEHSTKTIASAFNLFESSVRSFVREEYGRETAEQIVISDIKKLEDIVEPVVDCILLYRLESDPYRIHVYQKRTNIIKSAAWGWGTKNVLLAQFRRTNIFELEEYDKMVDLPPIPPPLPGVEMVPIGPSQIKIPKPMTVSPMRDLINELKTSSKFKARFVDTDDHNHDQCRIAIVPKADIIVIDNRN